MSKVQGVTVGYPMVQVLTDTGLTVSVVIGGYGDCFIPFPQNITQLIYESRARNSTRAKVIAERQAQAEAHGHP